MDDFNWDEIQKDAGGQFLPKAQVGTYTAVVETVDVRETKNAQGQTSYWLDLLLQDSETNSFPKISHPISFKNPKGSWRKWHFMNVLKELGIPEIKAKQAIQNAESKNEQDKIVAAYHAMFDRATQKHPSIDINVYEDDNVNPNTGRPYMRADFANPSLAFARTAKPATSTEDPLAGAIAIDLSQDGISGDIPF